ncbi:MAG: dehydrogenase [Sphingobacteriales bacterium]|nr:dehydrogenase [Sphingobacteriales bacterium]
MIYRSKAPLRLGLAGGGTDVSPYSDLHGGAILNATISLFAAFAEMLKLPLGDYDIAHYAYEIERRDLQLAGGKQDQYAATFGGVNFMEFYGNDKVIVNPLRIRPEYLHELENNLVLYFTSTSRESATIIKEQQKNVNDKNEKSIEAMHQLKEQSKMMKEALLKGRLHEVGEILDYGFQQKRLMAANISNNQIEEIYEGAKKAGATGGKISGAGGGGFMTFYCPVNTRYKVIETLENLGGYCKNYQFTNYGLTTWTI